MKTTKIYLHIVATLLLMPALLKAQWDIVRWDKVNDLTKVTAIDSNHAFVMGRNNSVDFLLRTNDGGNTWDSIPVHNQTNHYASDIFFLDKDNGFIAGYNQGIYTWSLAKTVDKGNTWTDITPTTTPSYFHPTSVFFINSQIGFMTSSVGYTLRKTLDGGTTWTSEKISFITTDSYFVDQNNGFVSGSDSSDNSGVVMKTSDGGKNWNTALSVNTPEPINKLDFVDANIAFASSTSKLFRTKDGGISWDTLNFQSQISGSITDFDFTSIDNGHLIAIAYGGFGVTDTTNLYRTTDGGKNWILEYSAEALTGYGGTSGYYLNSFSFIDNTGFVVGTNGVIKKHTSTTTGIKEEKLNRTANVYPNPFTTKAIIDVTNEIKNGLLTIYDLSGREVKNINFSGKQVILERENLESGVYFYKIGSKEKITATGKLLVQ